MNAKIRHIQDRLSQKENEILSFQKLKMMFYNDVNIVLVTSNS